MKKSVYLLSIFTIIIFLFIGCFPQDQEEPDHKTDGVDNSQVSEGAIEAEEGMFVGDHVKDFYIENNNGKGVQMSELTGKVTILNFWTSWSLESEYVNAIFSECSDIFSDSIYIASVNVTAVEGHNLEYVIKYIRSKGYEFPIYFDLEGDVAKQYLIRSFPTTYIIDTDGTIANIYIGEIDKEEFFDEIRKLINE